MKIIPLNTDKEGNCSCLKANYYKMGGANFLGHTNDGLKATCVMETIERDTPMKGKYKQRIEMGSNTTTSVQKDSLVNVIDKPKYLEFRNFISLGDQNDSYNRVWEIDNYCGALNCTKQMEILEPMDTAEPNVLTPKRTDFGKQVRKQYESGELDMSRHDMTELEPRTDGVSNTLTSVQKDNLLAEPIFEGVEAKVKQIGNLVDDSNRKFKNPQTGRIYDTDGLSPTVNTCQGGGREPKIATSYRIRKLTPRECFRLMGVDDADIDKIQSAGISNSAQYKLAGNSIVVDVLYHIFRKAFIETSCESKQLTLF